MFTDGKQIRMLNRHTFINCIFILYNAHTHVRYTYSIHNSLQVSALSVVRVLADIFQISDQLTVYMMKGLIKNQQQL